MKRNLLAWESSHVFWPAITLAVFALAAREAYAM
jgi:hypothetical protein